MRSISRVLATSCLGLATLGLAGCSQDNEDFIKAQQAANEAKGQEAGASKSPNTQAEVGKRAQEQMKSLKAAGYPGAK